MPEPRPLARQSGRDQARDPDHPRPAVRARIQPVQILGCTSATCTKSWGLTVDGVPVAGSERRAEASIGAEYFQTLTPFGVTDVLEPGTHTIGLTQKPGTGNFMNTNFAGSHLAAIALGV